MAYCVPDFTQTLPEGTVHLAFSSTFTNDYARFHDTALNDMDVLVARSPTVRACDIQKVRAVLSPQLSRLKDVIVFSTRGSVSLASKLAGGDYDGDMVWVCWERSIVQAFENTPVPEEPRPEELGIVREKTRMKELPPASSASEMIRRGFMFGANPAMLGQCTAYFQRHDWADGSITRTGSTWIAALLGYLVDQPKQGYRFTMAAWNRLRRRNDLVVGNGKSPAYYDNFAVPPTDHILDHLQTQVAKPLVESTLAEFCRGFQDIPKVDEHLSEFWKQAKVRGANDKEIGDVLKTLEDQIRHVHGHWPKQLRGDLSDPSDSGFRVMLAECFRKYKEILPPSSTHPLIAWWQQREQVADRASEWKLLRASATFTLYRDNRFPWHMAGQQLIVLKLRALGRMRPVDERIHETYKPAAAFFRKREERLSSKRMDENEVEEDEGKFDLVNSTCSIDLGC
ncbi:MAG: hypothetical protein M1826_007326 [Phylliscum demangeonii]|nr:MAG: hypothetical protein M1826_007326 [Phylliscum demangeonii]